MTKTGVAAVLRTAANAARSAVEGLNQVTHACPCCGLNKAEDWDEAQVAQQATAAADRLDRLAAQLERKAGL